MEAPASNKRQVEGAGAEAPPSKSVKFASDAASMPPPPSNVGFKLPPGSHGEAGASASAAAAGATVPAVHANQKVGVPVDLDGGYRCSKTGRWIGNGDWVRPTTLHSHRALLREPSRRMIAALVCRACAETTMGRHRRRQLGWQLLVRHSRRPAGSVQKAGAREGSGSACCRRGRSRGGGVSVERRCNSMASNKLHSDSY